MKAVLRICILATAAALAAPALASAGPRESLQAPANPREGAGVVLNGLVSVPKSGLAQTLGARAVATANNSLAGGFELKQSTTVYLLVRGNSLRDLGINTTTYLDYPRVHIFNSQGQDLVFDINGNAGFNQCTSSNSASAPVVNFYTNQRGAPPNARDACGAFNFAAGVYTFGVQPSIPGVTVPTGYTASDLSSGDTLFEITLNP